jgi:hypothetical protein
MHAGEGRHDRSRPYPSLAWRVLIGAFMGSYLGVLDLWVYNSDLAGIFAVTAADPKFASADGFDNMLRISVAHFQEAVLCSPARCAAELVLGLIEHQGVYIGSIALALGAGALLGALIALFARTS